MFRIGIDEATERQLGAGVGVGTEGEGDALREGEDSADLAMEWERR